jgi:Ni,Fe-hydrogenase I large subunit
MNKKYTWAKAPRLQGKPMEVGALARMVVAYAAGQPTAKKLIDDTLAKIGHPGQPQVLFGIIGRIAARALECKMVADSMYQWGIDIIENIKKGNTAVYADYEIPEKAQGIGLWEAPRGALGHWIDVEGKKIKNYQCVCLRPGTSVRGTTTEFADRSKRRSSGRRCMMPRSRWRSCAWCIPSTRALLVRCM